MEGLNSLSLNQPSLRTPTLPSFSPKASADVAIVQSLTDGRSRGDRQTSIASGISLTARKIIERLNELLRHQLPEGVYSLRQEDHTSEATANRIVSGITALFHGFLKQREGQDDLATLDDFMAKVRSGVKKGYEEAFGILEALGAFSFDGVQSSIEKTKELIEQKLGLFEEEMKKMLSPAEKTMQHAASATTADLLAQGGVNLLNVTA